MTSENTRTFAQQLDTQDALRDMRAEFHIPVDRNGRDEVYLCGNSLGLQPKRTAVYVAEFLRDWQELAVRGHLQAKYAWLPYHEYLTQGSADLVGALPSEVVTMNSLTTNLHLLMVSFFRPTATRHKILIEANAFPSDRYAVASQLRFHGFDPDTALLALAPRPGEACLRTDDILASIEREAETLALILLPGVQYQTGEVFDMQRIAETAQRARVTLGLDLAHAAGNIPLRLHDWNVDFAAWCSYKYLNSGPGSVAGAFVHEKHVSRTDLPRFAGWWGHRKSTRFQMGPEFEQISTAEGWQLSNPPILSLAAVRASLDTFARAGGMEALRRKSLELTGYLRRLLEQELNEHIEVLTPRESARHGCQLSLRLPRHDGKQLQQELEANGIACDFREPNVLRVAPTPLYNRFSDCFDFVHALKQRL